MSHLFYFILFVGFLAHQTAFSQKKWDGGGGSNLWSNASNWTGNTLPTATDDVVFDNSLLAGNYTVVLPSSAVTVKSITITPNPGRTIDVTLPSSNTAVPGLTANGPGYGLTINSGGTFRNSSGSSSGNTVRVTDSIKINNDGKYIHNSASAHTSNVQVLSLASGTERGILELDIPTASSTISFSGRTFGKLVLRSTAAGGTCNYTAAGTNRVMIRNGLDLGAGVTFNLNCSDTIFVGGDFIQDAGTLNLGNSTRSVVLSLQQTITQNTGATITETGSGVQTVLINGSGLQLVTMRGTIANQVGIVKDGGGLALLKAPLTLSYRFSLKSGRVVTSQGLITLTAACTLTADSLADQTFIDGPLKKDGLVNQSFLFPVGKSGTMRWMQMQNATGNFTVEYFRADPHTLSNGHGTGVHHFSQVEYWDVTTSAGATSKIKLSFVLPGSGMVTNLSSLRVARLINGTWEDAGNSNVAGTPGSDGWVSSNAASGFSASSKSFALASASGQENPLPISSLQLKAEVREQAIRFSWKANPDINISKFYLQLSDDGTKFSEVQAIDRTTHILNYSPVKADGYYRMVAISDEHHEYTSNVLYLRKPITNGISILGSNVVSCQLLLNNKGSRPGMVQLFDASGRNVKVFRIGSSFGVISLNVSDLKAGCYYLKSKDNSDFGNTLKFIKL
ncbi:MAG: hypothetical protein JNK79_08690 [Chitinophagaceae bacterium]|nr:hypothetical protein [Chitinophagaceae bacterium]